MRVERERERNAPAVAAVAVATTAVVEAVLAAVVAAVLATCEAVAVLAAVVTPAGGPVVIAVGPTTGHEALAREGRRARTCLNTNLDGDVAEDVAEEGRGDGRVRGRRLCQIEELGAGTASKHSNLNRRTQVGPVAERERKGGIKNDDEAR